MTTVPLNEHGLVTLNGSGNGVAKVGPLSAREVWHPSNVHISTFQAAGTVTNEAQGQIFVGNDTSQQNYRDGSQSASTGDSSDRVNADSVSMGQFVWCIWTGGDAGVTAIISVTGTKDV